MSGIWVFAEHDSGALERVTLELLGEARRLARETEAEVFAVVFGDRVAALVDPLAHYGADVIHVFEDERLRHYDPGPVVASLGRLCEAQSARVVLLPATTTGSDVAVRLAMEHDWPLASRATATHVRDGDLEFVRPIARNAVHAFVRPARSGPCLVTIAADVIGVDRPDTSRSARVVREALVVPDAALVAVGEFIASDPRTLDILEAEIVVSAGRGVGSKENIRLVQELADALGGSVGATRVVVDLGWLPKDRQVGQTGKTVTPRLYVACGISGATAHTIGMKDAATIIAINTDAAAPIFKIADLGVQADVSSVLPVLAARCRRQPQRSA
jgi:electron transfer flavoprotein alpha subunit